MSAQEFLIQVLSNDSIQFFPRNTNSNFRVQLPSPLNLSSSSEWDVALSSIQFPSKCEVSSFLQTSEFWLTIEETDDENKATYRLDFFEAKHIRSAEDLISYMNKEMKKIMGTDFTLSLTADGKTSISLKRPTK